MLLRIPRPEGYVGYVGLTHLHGTYRLKNLFLCCCWALGADRSFTEEGRNCLATRQRKSRNCHRYPQIEVGEEQLTTLAEAAEPLCVVLG